MRRPLVALALLALAALVAACSSSAEPGWTYTPASPTAAASAAPSAVPSGEPPASAPASEAPSAAPSEAPGGDVVAISALNIAFEQTEVSAPADTAFVIRFENKDAGIPHNVEIKDANGAQVFMGEIFNGVETRDYQVPALPAGTYQFICTVHPNMVGTLTVG